MKVLLVTQRFPPALGGVETWAAELAGALTELGHHVLVLSRDSGSPARDTDRDAYSTWTETTNGFTVLWTHQSHENERGFRDSWHNPMMAAPMLRALSDFNPDIVHVAHNDGWGVTPLRFAEAAGIPTVVTLHDYKWICARGQMMRPGGDRCTEVSEDRCVRCIDRQLRAVPARRLLRRVLAGPPRQKIESRDELRIVENRPDPGPRARQAWRRRQLGLLAALHSADRVTSPSQFVADRMCANGLDREVLVVPNGAGADPRSSGEEPRRLPRPVRVGVFGRPKANKGFDFLVTAFQSLPPGAAELHIHGADAAEFTGALPPGATAHGPYPSGTSADLMRAIDVVAIPSLWDENHPMIAVEALRARRPLIVSNLGGLPELVRHDIDGWVLGAGDAEAWGQQLALLAADPGRITAAQKQLPPPRGGRAMASDFVDLYESVLSPATGTRP